MSTLLRRYLAEIGRRGGIKSRRALSPETARRMVAIREARRTARRALANAPALPLGGTPDDTSPAAQAIQDELWRRTPPAKKLAQVARLSRMVDQLSIAGLRQRHAGASEPELLQLRAQLRLGPELAARVHSASRDVT